MAISASVSREKKRRFLASLGMTLRVGSPRSLRSLAMTGWAFVEWQFRVGIQNYRNRGHIQLFPCYFLQGGIGFAPEAPSRPEPIKYCSPIKKSPLIGTSSNAPGKEGREQSDRWKETLNKGFLPRVSPGSGGLGRTYHRPSNMSF